MRDGPAARQRVNGVGLGFATLAAAHAIRRRRDPR